MLANRQFTCWYCNQKTNCTYPRNTRRFDCHSCQATNFLDEKGDISDPPHDLAGPSVRFATSVEPSKIGNHVFCDECRKNQEAVLEMKKEYLPPPSDPDEELYVRAYPKWLKGVEQNHPQVCAKCDAPVMEGMEQSTYKALITDLKYLQRRTAPKVSEICWSGPTWKSTLVYWTGWFWWASIAMHLFWSILGIYAVRGRFGPGVHGQFTQKVIMCSMQAWTHGTVQWVCMSSFQDEMRLSLWTMVVTFWWNNRLHVTAKGPSVVRLSGLRKHYLVQLLMMGLRTGSYWLLRDPVSSQLATEDHRAIHLCVVLALITSTMYSSVVVKVRTPQSKSPNTGHTTSKAKVSKKSDEILGKAFDQKPVQKPVQKPAQKPAEKPAEPTNPTQRRIIQNRPESASPFLSRKVTAPSSMPAKQLSLTASLSALSTQYTDHGSRRPFGRDPDEMDWNPTLDSTTGFHAQHTISGRVAGQQPRQQPRQTVRDKHSPFGGTTRRHTLKSKQRSHPTPKGSLVFPLDELRDFDMTDDEDSTLNISDLSRPSDAGWVDDSPQKMIFEDPKLHLPSKPVDTGLEGRFFRELRISGDPIEVQEERFEQGSHKKKDGLVDQLRSMTTSPWLTGFLSIAFASPFVVVSFEWTLAWLQSLAFTVARGAVA